MLVFVPLHVTCHFVSLTAFKFFFVFFTLSLFGGSLIMMCLPAFLFMSFAPGAHWASWVCLPIVFNIFAIFLANIQDFFPPIFLLFIQELQLHIHYITWFSHFNSPLIFRDLFFLYILFWRVSISMSWSSLIFSFATINLPVATYNVFLI